MIDTCNKNYHRIFPTTELPTKKKIDYSQKWAEQHDQTGKGLNFLQRLNFRQKLLRQKLMMRSSSHVWASENQNDDQNNKQKDCSCTFLLYNF